MWAVHQEKETSRRRPIQSCLIQDSPPLAGAGRSDNYPAARRRRRQRQCRRRPGPSKFGGGKPATVNHFFSISPRKRGVGRDSRPPAAAASSHIIREEEEEEMVALL